MWTLAFGHHEDRPPAHGYAESRPAAMTAFAKAGGGSEPGLSAQCSCSFSFSTVMGTLFALTKIATARLKDVGPSY
jgi:hypothetical protein